jgi:hypothetical protein
MDHMDAVPKTKNRSHPSRVRPKTRIDVPRPDYTELRDLSLRNEAAIKRIETELRVQFQRIAEIQAQLDSRQWPNPAPRRAADDE